MIFRRNTFFSDKIAEDDQHLEAHVNVEIGDLVSVFHNLHTTYEAKVKQVAKRESCKWPEYFVHYPGWNSRYDEWITRSMIKEKLSLKQSTNITKV